MPTFVNMSWHRLVALLVRAKNPVVRYHTRLTGTARRLEFSFGGYRFKRTCNVLGGQHKYFAGAPGAPELPLSPGEFLALVAEAKRAASSQ